MSRFLRFVLYILRISDKGCLGVYCQSNLLDRMLRLHSYQLVLKTIVLIFNTAHKMGCCEYCYWLGRYNLWHVKSGSLNYPFIVGIIKPVFFIFFFERYAPTATSVLLFIIFIFVLFLILCFWHLHYVIFVFQ